MAHARCGEDDGAGRRRQREQVGVKVRCGGHVSRFPVSRWVTISRSAPVTRARAWSHEPVADPLPEVFQAVVGVAPVRRPGGGRQDGAQAGQRLVQVGQPGVVAGVDPRARAGQARQKRGAAAAVRRRPGAVAGAGAVRGRRLGVAWGRLVPQLGDQDRLAGAVGGVLGAGRDHLDRLGLDALVGQHVVTVVGVLGVLGRLPPVKRDHRAAPPPERAAVQSLAARAHFVAALASDAEAEQADRGVAVNPVRVGQARRPPHDQAVGAGGQFLDDGAGEARGLQGLGDQPSRASRPRGR